MLRYIKTCLLYPNCLYDDKDYNDNYTIIHANLIISISISQLNVSKSDIRRARLYFFMLSIVLLLLCYVICKDQNYFFVHLHSSCVLV